MVVKARASHVFWVAVLAVSLPQGASCHRPPRRVTPLPRAKSSRGIETYWTAKEIVLEPIEPPPDTKVDARTFVDALDEEVRAWNAALRACRGVPRLAVGAVRAHGAARDDGHNVVALLGASWCPADRRGIQGCYDPAAQAVTQVRTRDDLAGPLSGEIREADIEVNGVDFHWSSQGGAAGTRSLRAILGHELGHVLGLSHSCSGVAPAQGEAGASACSPGDRLSIMYPDPTEPGRDVVLVPGDDAIATLCAATPADREGFEWSREDRR